MKTRELSLAVVFSSLYAVLVVALAPISYGPVQLRVADCLIPLAALFGWPVISGVTVGCFLGNAYFWLGPQDVVFGTIANLVAAAIIFLLRKRQFLACVAGSLPIGIIVGSYLWIFFPPPSIFGLQLPIWGAMIVSITISSLVAMAGIGYAILKALSSSSVTRALKSLGVKVYIEE
ncbi:MAG: QueT transporter family protein [Candidatus Bathyarchaeota archaeon]